MRVSINPVNSHEEECAIINAVEVTEDIRNAVDILSNNCCMIPVIKDGASMMCRTDRIYYIESIDKRTYIYTKDGCYETKYRLYELDDILNRNFLRCAKAMILNIRKINAVKADINGRMTASLLNGEKVVIARNYVKELKERLGV